jgi:hypothetical protein
MVTRPGIMRRSIGWASLIRTANCLNTSVALCPSILKSARFSDNLTNQPPEFALLLLTESVAMRSVPGYSIRTGAPLAAWKGALRPGCIAIVGFPAWGEVIYRHPCRRCLSEPPWPAGMRKEAGAHETDRKMS